MLLFLGIPHICNVSVCTCTHTEEYSMRTNGQTVYLKYQTPQTTTLANTTVQMTPTGNRFANPLHGILTGHGQDLLYVYVYRPITSTKVTIVLSTPQLLQEPTHFHVSYPNQALLFSSEVLRWSPVLT